MTPSRRTLLCSAGCPLQCISGHDIDCMQVVSLWPCNRCNLGRAKLNDSNNFSVWFLWYFVIIFYQFLCPLWLLQTGMAQYTVPWANAGHQIDYLHQAHTWWNCCAQSDVHTAWIWDEYRWVIHLMENQDWSHDGSKRCCLVKSKYLVVVLGEHWEPSCTPSGTTPPRMLLSRIATWAQSLGWSRGMEKKIYIDLLD